MRRLEPRTSGCSRSRQSSLDGNDNGPETTALKTGSNNPTRHACISMSLLPRQAADDPRCAVGHPGPTRSFRRGSATSRHSPWSPTRRRLRGLLVGTVARPPHPRPRGWPAQPFQVNRDR